MNALGLSIIGALPDWARIVESGEAWLRVEVTPRHQSGAPGRSFDLRIETGSPAGTVSEAHIGSTLPPTCPERHINYGGTFCLGLDRAAIVDREGAVQFWQTLRTYLLSQQFAEKHKRWPPGRGLSHGDAAHIQIEAEGAAARCGLAADYAAAIDYHVGWLAGPMPKTHFEEGANERICPMGPDEDGRIGLHLGCEACNALAELVRLETRRREAETVFNAWSRTCRPCCGTMHRCPLREEHTEATNDGEPR